MPVPNDLSAEDEREFANHGVQSAGPGREPLDDGTNQQGGEQGQQQNQQDDVDDENFTQQDLARQQEAQNEPKPGELGSRHRADGTFKSADELEADRQTLAEQTRAQGQQGGEQGQQRTVPHEALHQERMRTAQLSRQIQLLSARTNALLQAQQQGQQGGTQMPDLEADPAGFVRALDERLALWEYFSWQ
jgi:hypothetical protein